MQDFLQLLLGDAGDEDAVVLFCAGDGNTVTDDKDTSADAGKLD